MSLSAQQRPLYELEAAHEAAETLLADHKNMLPAELAARLASFNNDLAVVIDGHYGIRSDDADDADDADA
jgi:hypothetical protein